MILIVSHPDDVHARAVIEEIAVAGGNARLLNLSDFPQSAGLTIGWETQGRADLVMRWPDGGELLPLGEIGAVWWRRPQPMLLHGDLTDQGYRDFATGECAEAIGGLWHLLDSEWVNPPIWDDRAHRKPLQLQVARECGLATPATCMTNDPEAAAAFVAQHGAERVIYKGFAGTEAEWRETRLLGRERAGDLAAIRFAPVILQTFVPCRFDVRLTIVDEEMFAAAIHSQESAYPLDFRMDVLNSAITPIDVPNPVRAAVLRMMGELRLVYGAADFRVTPQGEWIFLEINPAGQWLFIEDVTGQPIARTLALRLVASDAARLEGRRPMGTQEAYIEEAGR